MKITKRTSNRITAQERLLNFNDLSLLCAFGKHHIGGWCAIFNFGCCAEISSSQSKIEYNAEVIFYALDNAPINREQLPYGKELKQIAECIAKEITPLLSNNSDTVYDCTLVCDLFYYPGGLSDKIQMILEPV